MKKLLLVASLLVATVAALAQGSVNFLTKVTAAVPPINAPVHDVDGTTLLSGTSFWAQLYWGPTADSLAAVGSPVNFKTSILAGYVNAGAVTMESSTAVFVQMRAWNAPYATYEAALNVGKWGFSNTISLTPGMNDPTKTPLDLTGLQGFNLTVIPEPSTIALALLGAAALLLRRRS